MMIATKIVENDVAASGNGRPWAQPLHPSLKADENGFELLTVKP